MIVIKTPETLKGKVSGEFLFISFFNFKVCTDICTAYYKHTDRVYQPEYFRHLNVCKGSDEYDDTEYYAHDRSSKYRCFFHNLSPHNCVHDSLIEVSGFAGEVEAVVGRVAYLHYYDVRTVVAAVV